MTEGATTTYHILFEGRSTYRFGNPDEPGTPVATVETPSTWSLTDDGVLEAEPGKLFDAQAVLYGFSELPPGAKIVWRGDAR